MVIVKAELTSNMSALVKMEAQMCLSGAVRCCSGSSSDHVSFESDCPQQKNDIIFGLFVSAEFTPVFGCAVFALQNKISFMLLSRWLPDTGSKCDVT